MIKKYLFNILIGFDQFINTLMGGDPDDTISGRMGRILANRIDCPLCMFMCHLLNYLEKDHCNKSIEADEGDRDLLNYGVGIKFLQFFSLLIILMLISLGVTKWLL